MGPSKSPTKQEREWMDRVQAYGCCACRKDGHYFEPAEIHHIVSGNKRMGHMFSLPLCSRHHRHGTQDEPSIHPWKARFVKRYGSELQLLAELQVALGVYDEVRA